MLDGNSHPLYIGKALNLKKRLSQYQKPGCNRIQSLISQIHAIETTITNSELDALILESELIKSLQPKYNILLKDDKSFSFIHVSIDEDFPRINKYRGKRIPGAYGPFFSAIDAQNNIVSLQKTFLLRSCSSQIFKGRTRPCLEYQIKRCSAPCVHKISKDDYQNSVKQALSALEGNVKSIQSQLITKMTECSANLEYEKAAAYRDKIRSLQQISLLTIDSGIQDGHVFGTYSEMELTCIRIFIFKNSQRCGDLGYYLNQNETDKSPEMIADFIMQYCETYKPSEIYIDTEIPELYTKATFKKFGTKIHCPRKGPKMQIVSLAHQNAKEALLQKISTSLKNEKDMAKLGEFFGLPKTPERIEVYDNSHIYGTNAVGAMIVMTKIGFLKNAYRQFDIRESKPGDDYGMMREIISRRLNSNDPLPDFILLDGGLGQLSAVSDLLLGAGIPFASISKGPQRKLGEETIHTIKDHHLKLSATDPLLHFLQRIRDEAHRFAIKAHRRKRLSDARKSILDTIPGVGEKRKKALYTYFGSIQKLRQASVEQVAAVPGISTALATIIIENLRSKYK